VIHAPGRWIWRASRKPLSARVLGVLISEMGISESFVGEFGRSVELWGKRRERNVFRDFLGGWGRCNAAHLSYTQGRAVWVGCPVWAGP